MKILILGSDGYIGWPLTLHLLKEGHEVAGIDSYIRRTRVRNCGSDSLTPILSTLDRLTLLRKYPNYIKGYGNLVISLGEYEPFIIRNILRDLKPDTIVHLAEQSSAPWSMISSEKASETQLQNVIGTLHLLWAMKEVCPEAHLVKIGSLGEYGTPNCDIPEGFIKRDCSWRSIRCPMADLPFPKSPNSFYHLSKVHDTHNIIFACSNWNLRSTDIMQGVVFGVKVTDNESESELTRFDYDQYFGTVINRFCAQAIIEYPLTIYGRGDQLRGFLSLSDSIQCLTLAIENPPNKSEYRVFNQFESTRSINGLAKMVVQSAGELGLKVEISHLENPRKEKEIHHYNPAHQKLFDLGYKPTANIYQEIQILLSNLLPYKDRIIKEVILPTTRWI